MMNRSSLLGRFRFAINKLTFLLRTFRLISLLRSSTPILRHRNLLPPRRHSFNAGLIDAVLDEDSSAEAGDVHGVDDSERRMLHRSASEASTEEGDPEIDGKSEVFIMNFYRRLRNEKQISLELQYCRGFSSSSSSSNSLVSPLSIGLSVTSPT